MGKIIESALDVACPKCGAGPGERCNADLSPCGARCVALGRAWGHTEAVRALRVGFYVGQALNHFVSFLQCLHRDDVLRTYDENGESNRYERFQLAIGAHKIALDYATFAAFLLGARGPARILDAHVFIEELGS